MKPFDDNDDEEDWMLGKEDDEELDSDDIDEEDLSLEETLAD